MTHEEFMLLYNLAWWFFIMYSLNSIFGTTIRVRQADW